VAVSDRPIPLAPLQHLAAAALRREYPAMVEAMVGWRPIETAPKDGTEVDLWSTGRTPNARWGKYRLHPLYNDDTEHEGWVVRANPYDFGAEPDWMDIAHFNPGGVTHWMPLPDPPK
jgi:hypothetical protein